MRSIISAIVVVMGSASALQADEQVPIQVLNKIKAATVYIKVRTPAGGGTGSGFLVKVDDKHFIVTNDHVVNHEEPAQKGGKAKSGQAAKPKIEVVFHSGQPNEFSVDTEIVAADPVVDLAVLKLAGNRYLTLQPLEFTKPVKPVETLPIFMLGFPSAARRLAARETNPAITVGRGSISSIRNDEKGNRVIQIDGDVNPGNSGGPVVDSTGRLVGVTVAKILRTNIGMVIPADEIPKLFEPRIPTLTIAVDKLAGGVASAVCRADVFDPLGKLQKLHVRYRSAEGSPPINKNKKDKTWDEVPDAKTIELPVKGRLATAILNIEMPESKRQKCVFQLVGTFSDNTVGRSDALAFTIEPAKSATISAKDSKSIKGSVSLIDKAPGRKRAETVAGTVKMQTLKVDGSYSRAPLCWSNDGKALFHIAADGIVGRLSCTNLKEEATFASDVTTGAWLSSSSVGLVVSGGLSPKSANFNIKEGFTRIILVDPTTLQPIRTIKEADLIRRVVASPNSPYAYAQAQLRRGQHGLFVIDLARGEVVRRYNASDLKLPDSPHLRTYVTSDGKTLLIRDEEHIYRYQLNGDTVTFEMASPPFLWKDQYQELAISYDGNWIRTNCKKVEETQRRTRFVGSQENSPSHLIASASLQKPALVLDTRYYSGDAGFDRVNGWVYVNEHDRIEVFSVEHGDLVAEFMTGDALGGREIQRMLVHPDGRYIAYSMNEPNNKSQRIVLLELRPDAAKTDE